MLQPTPVHSGAAAAITLVQINVVAHAFQKKRTQPIKHFSSGDGGLGRAYYACPHELPDVIRGLPHDPDLACYEQLQIIAHAGVAGLTVRLDADVVCRAGNAVQHGVARPSTVVRVSLDAKKQCTLSRESTLCGVPLWEWCTAVPTGAAAAWNRGDCSCPHRHKVRIFGFDAPPKLPRLLKLPRLFSLQNRPQQRPEITRPTAHAFPTSQTAAASQSSQPAQLSQSRDISPTRAVRAAPRQADAPSNVQMRMHVDKPPGRVPIRTVYFDPAVQHATAPTRAPPPPPLQPRSQSPSLRSSRGSSFASTQTIASSTADEKSPRFYSAPGPVPCPAPAPEDTPEDRPLTVLIVPQQVLFQVSSYAPFEIQRPATDGDYPWVEPLKLGPSTAASTPARLEPSFTMVPQARAAVQPAVAFIPIIYPFQAARPPLACAPASRPVSITYQDALSGPADVYISELEKQISSIFDLLYIVNRRR